MKKMLTGLAMFLVMTSAQAAMLKCEFFKASPETGFKAERFVKTAQISDESVTLDLTVTKNKRKISALFAKSAYTNENVFIFAVGKDDQMTVGGKNAVNLSVEGKGKFEESIDIECSKVN